MIKNTKSNIFVIFVYKEILFCKIENQDFLVFMKSSIKKIVPNSAILQHGK